MESRDNQVVAAAPLLAELADIVGAAHVLSDPDLVAGYVTDWTGQWRGAAAAVVRPGDADEVAAVLAACHRAGWPVVPQGGNTGLVGGSIPMEGEILLSTTRLDQVETVDPVGRTIAAGAGVTVARAQAAARAHGLDFGVDLASRESATLGGIVATNAGGIRVVKHGDTRRQVVGVEAVLADGRVLTRWKHLAKDNVGYDLPGLLTGSEGTLAVITRVLMRLVVPATETQVALVGVLDVGSALTLLDRLERAGRTLEAAELMTADGIALVRAVHGLRAPLSEDTEFVLLVEVSGGTLAEVLAEAPDLVIDAVVEPGPARRLWEYREAHTESISAESATPPLKLDISTPVGELASFLLGLDADLAALDPAPRAITFGHLGEGNMHVNLLDVPDDRREELTDLVLARVAAHGGSISAEHGVGRAKAQWIGLSRTEIDIDVMRSVRAALDPAKLLNPAILPS
ncbi:FAD-binding oxidoreductase [Nocardia camponoti]|uniref:FAD-binding oxidoreductase n=1 Tax=Nocardia camponoti TaxID=1616106 RepID=UPI0035710B5A